jgi:CTD small phosphatase-like protein 2
VVVFTAGLKDYADWILDELDPEKYISWRLYRDSCILRHGSYLKDLKIIGRDFSKIVIVDNLPENFSL